MKRFLSRQLSRLIALVLVAAIALTGCAAGGGPSLTGDYRQDTLALISSLRTAIDLPDGSAEKAAAQSDARQKINDFASRYRRDPALANLTSYTTMRTILNTIAGHYSSSPNRPLPQKMKQQLEQEFQQVEGALKRGA